MLILTRPVDGFADPAAVDPVVDDPVVDDPVVADPVVADPAVADSAVDDPAIAESAATDPAVAGSTVADPAATGATGPPPVAELEHPLTVPSINENITPALLCHLALAESTVRHDWPLPAGCRVISLTFSANIFNLNFSIVFRTVNAICCYQLLC